MKIKTLVTHGVRRIRQEFFELAYLNTRCDHTKPISIKALVNERCNYRCQYCNFWRLDEYQDEMSIVEWSNALQCLKDFIGVYAIQFSGGEPFLKKGFFELLEFCHREGIHWGVITNGSVLKPRHVSRLVAASPLNLDISVDGTTASTHDVVRGVPGSLKTLEEAIPNLAHARDALGQRFPIRIKPTVHRLNFRELPRLVEWARTLRATSIDFAPVRPWTTEVTKDLWIEENDLSALDAVVKQLIKMKREGRPVETAESQLESWVPHFRGERIVPVVVPCRAGMRDYHIHPNGDVSLCWHYPRVGNVKEASAKEIWYGKLATEQRDAMVNCSKLGAVDCANSCLAQRPIRQEIKRALMFRRHRATNV